MGDSCSKVLHESGTVGMECYVKVENGKKVESTIKTLLNAMSLESYCIKVLHKGVLVPVLKN